MPRKSTFSKEEVVEKALSIVGAKGPEALTARTLGVSLGASSSPIFTLFGGMDEVVAEVRKAAKERFDRYVADVSEYNPAFKEFGMRLIRFAREEPHLFRYLFLSKEVVFEGGHPQVAELMMDVRREFCITQEQADLLVRQMWTFACGLAVLCNREPQDYPDEVVGEMISVQFFSLLAFFKSGREWVVVEPRRRGGKEEE